MFQSKVGSYLEEFLDRLQLIPSDVRRGLELVGDLDSDSNDLLTEIKELQKSYIAKARRRIRDRSARGGGNLAELAEDRPALEELKAKRRHARQRADERINNIAQLRRMINYHAGVLDANLLLFRDNLEKAGKLPPELVRSTSGVSVASGRGSGSGSVAGSGWGRSSKHQRGGSQAKVQTAPAVEEVAIDPNEEVYCYCRRVYFGDMIGCDNDDCPIEWFHFECVGLSEQPKGKWYCPDCRANSNDPTKKRR